MTGDRKHNIKNRRIPGLFGIARDTNQASKCIDRELEFTKLNYDCAEIAVQGIHDLHNGKSPFDKCKNCGGCDHKEVFVIDMKEFHKIVSEQLPIIAYDVLIDIAETKINLDDQIDIMNKCINTLKDNKGNLKKALKSCVTMGIALGAAAALLCLAMIITKNYSAINFFVVGTNLLFSATALVQRWLLKSRYNKLEKTMANSVSQSTAISYKYQRLYNEFSDFVVKNLGIPTIITRIKFM